MGLRLGERGWGKGAWGSLLARMLLSRKRQQRRDEKGFEGKLGNGVYVDIPPTFFRLLIMRS